MHLTSYSTLCYLVPEFDEYGSGLLCVEIGLCRKYTMQNLCGNIILS